MTGCARIGSSTPASAYKARTWAVRQFAMFAARQIAWQFQHRVAHLRYAADTEAAAFEQCPHGGAAMRMIGLDTKPAICALAACCLDTGEGDRRLVVTHFQWKAGDVEIRRYQHARDVRGRNRCRTTTQCVGEAAIGRQQQQTTVTSLHGIDHQPAHAAFGGKSLHHRLATASSSAMFIPRDPAPGVDGLMLRLVIHQHLRSAGSLAIVRSRRRRRWPPDRPGENCAPACAGTRFSRTRPSSIQRSISRREPRP